MACTTAQRTRRFVGPCEGLLGALQWLGGCRLLQSMRLCTTARRRLSLA
jgi:hypothetical protein